MHYMNRAHWEKLRQLLSSLKLPAHLDGSAVGISIRYNVVVANFIMEEWQETFSAS